MKKITHMVNALKLDVALVQAMYSQTDAFSTIGVKIFEDLKRNNYQSPGNQFPGFAFAPFVVNMTFSLELYLKTLARVHGAAPSRKHKLLVLYKELPVDARLAVLKASRASASEEDVVYSLGNINDSFMQWRYLYEPCDEPRTIAPQSVIWVAGVLRQACLESGWLSQTGRGTPGTVA